LNRGEKVVSFKGENAQCPNKKIREVQASIIRNPTCWKKGRKRMHQ